MYVDDIDLDNKIKFYLENESKREQIARDARNYIFENHSYENRMQYLIKQL
jgi:spore maturation protein CgeB